MFSYTHPRNTAALGLLFIYFNENQRAKRRPIGDTCGTVTVIQKCLDDSMTSPLAQSSGEFMLSSVLFGWMDEALIPLSAT